VHWVQASRFDAMGQQPSNSQMPLSLI
jgi:hypothetical protein